MEHDGRRDVVGEIGDDDGAFAAEHLGVVRLERVRLGDRHPEGLDHCAKGLDQVAIDLQCVDASPGLCEGQSQRAEPRPDLEYPITRSNLGQAGYPAHRIGVDDEVLAERP